PNREPAWRCYLLRAYLVCCWLGDIIRVSHAGGCCSLQLVPTWSRCSWPFSSDLLHSCSALRDKVSKIYAGRSPRLRRKLPSPICHSAAGSEPLRRFMRSSPREPSSRTATSITLTTTGWSCG